MFRFHFEVLGHYTIFLFFFFSFCFVFLGGETETEWFSVFNLLKKKKKKSELIKIPGCQIEFFSEPPGMSVFHIQHAAPKEISAKCSPDKVKEGQILIEQMSQSSLGLGISALLFCELFKLMMFVKIILSLTQCLVKTVGALLSTPVAFQIDIIEKVKTRELGRNSSITFRISSLLTDV